MRARRGTLVCVILAAATVVAAAGIHLMSAIGVYDDAYIIFRYVDNIARGRGPVYNAGEPVFGVSCPLYMLWLVPLRLLLPGLPLPVLAARGNTLFLIAAAALAWMLMRRLGLGPGRASLAAGAVAVSDGILRPSIGGMESSLYLVLVFGALLATVARRDGLAVLAGSLAALTRPEGGILLLVLVGAWLLDPPASRRDPRVLSGLLPLAIWGVFATVWYGSPIPHSVIAKAQPLYPLAAGSALEAVLNFTGRLTMGAIDLATVAAGATWHTPRIVHDAVGSLVLLWALWRWWREPPRARSARSLALPAHLLLLLVFYAVSNPLFLPWYLPVVQAPWLLVVLAAGHGRARAPWPWRAGRMAMTALVLAAAAVSLIWSILPGSPRDLLAWGATDAGQTALLRAYERSAIWLAGNAPHGARVAAAEIGILGYTLDRRILDGCGLVSPEALPYIPVPPEERGAQMGPIPSGLIRDQRPEFIVTLPSFIERSLLRAPWFASDYELVHQEMYMPRDPRRRAVLVYRRRDLAPVAGDGPYSWPRRDARRGEERVAIKAPLILSLQVGAARTLGSPEAADPMDRPWTTSIFKEPVEGPVWLSTTGLAGDTQTDDDHGGPEMAVLGYSAEHYPHWREELGQKFLKHGAFGENLTISRLDEETVCIGDIYALGEARVQVSLPRRPCWKLARRLRVNDMIERVHARAWGGWYHRVLTEGFVERSNFVVLEDRPFPRWTVARAYDVYHHRHERPDAALELSGCELLSPAWRERLRAAAQEGKTS